MPPVKGFADNSDRQLFIDVLKGQMPAAYADG